MANAGYQTSEHDILEAMTMYGGGFVKHLAVLFRLADQDNRRKLAVTFEQYFQQYDDLAAKRMASKEGKRP